jgi:hypothetical protein
VTINDIMTRTVSPAAVRRGHPPGATGHIAALTPRRRLQLVLAGLWVLDGLLKLQPFMFTKDFAPMTLGDASDGAPGWLAGLINWASDLVQHHPVGLMVLFALAELAIGFGIAWPRTVRPALLACILWVPFLWLFAEGLGGLAAGSASAFTGAPGASILYGVLAVLLWPTERGEAREAERFIGLRPARAIWVVLWGLLAFLAFRPANTAPDAFSDAISGNVDGTPSGYAWLLNHATRWTAGHGQALGIVFGIALALVALSVLAPWRRAARAGIVLALVLCALIWVFGEGLGMPFMGMGTDPDTGPLLALLAVAYWLPTRAPAGAAGTPTGGSATATAEGAAA